MRTFAMCAMLLGLFGIGAGCQKSIESQADDVREAKREKYENIADEQRDVTEAQREGAAEVREEQQDVNEAAREGEKNVREEQRDLQEAVRKNREENATVPSTTTPDVP